MATRTETVEPEGYGRMTVDAALAGVAAGIVFGLLVQFALGRMTTIGALYTLGEESLAVGWAAHIVNSAVFAMVYALATRLEGLRDYAEAPSTGVVVAGVYGFVLWFVNVGFIWPLWLDAVTFVDLPVPYFGAVGSLVGHLLWGVLLGALFAVLQDRR